MDMYLLLDHTAKPIYCFNADCYITAMRMAEDYRRAHCIFRAALFALVHNGKLGA
jgi:hypothetical protein